MKRLKKVLHYYKPYKGLFIADMVCALIVALCDLVYPRITQDIVNIHIPNKDIERIAVWCGGVLGLYLIKMFLNYIIQYWGHMVGVGIQSDMRRDMFTHLQKLPFSYFDENKTGSIMSRITNDLFSIAELAHHCPEDIFISTIMLIGSFVMLALIDIWLTLILFSVIPVIVVFAVLMRKRMKNAFKESKETMAEINANVELSLTGIRISKSYTGEEHEGERFEESNSLFREARRKSYRYMGQFFSGMGFLTDFLYLVVLFFGGFFFVKGWIDTGEFVAFLLYVTMFLKPINKLVQFFEQLQEGLTGIERFAEVMAVDEEKDAPDAVELCSAKGDISFDNVSFSYHNEDREENALVIKELSFDIKKGTKVALVGPSGGGKTTLCHLIPRFYELDEGKISIDGKDITSLTRRSLRENIGMVAQDVFLFGGTIRDNIEYGRLGASDEEIIEAAKKANIHDYIMTLEKGYDTEVGERGVKLSGGQKQRISIARVFLKNPSILILDEATSALDNETEMLIQASLDELLVGRTAIIVAHRLSTIKNADEIIVLTKDGISEKGSHEELLESGGIYAKLYKYQFRE
ncbi:MAG: ABC transporter ATP-binding protein [Ruminococcaceae bacterium]|nr:ABC transporter ATP-binding protein [Oscillospiraceae bacterium]